MEYFLLRPDGRINTKTEYTDYLEEREMLTSRHFISAELKKVFEFYETDIKYRPKKINGRQYWQIELKPVTDAVLKEFYKAEEMMIQEMCLEQRSIALIRNQRRDYLIVNLNVAESMLRRYMTGITYLKIKNTVDK